MPSNITSTTNANVKAIVRLRQKREKDSSITIIEGIKEISLAIKAKADITEAYVCEASLKDQKILDLLAKGGCKVYTVTTQVFEKISYGNRNEGILVLCDAVSKDLKEMKKKDGGLYVVIENVEKPGNLGAILRTCDSVGVDGVIICDSKSWIYSPGVVRASLGSVFSVDIYVATKEEAIKYLKDNNIKTYAATPDAKMIYADCDFKKSTAIIVGSEHDGLSEYFLKNSDEKITIPMMGKVDSLNVSTSTGILLYEIFRQRQFGN